MPILRASIIREASNAAIAVDKFKKQERKEMIGDERERRPLSSVDFRRTWNAKPTHVFYAISRRFNKERPNEHA